MAEELDELAAQVGEALRAGKRLLTVAESCTGGWIATTITAVPGSSEWFERGFVTYSNVAKTELLGVPATTLAAHGAVSPQTVVAMAEGALARSRAGVAVAVSGIAGPAGGSSAKPVGTVWLAWAVAGRPTLSRRYLFAGDREAVRRQAVVAALQGLVKLLHD